MIKHIISKMPFILIVCMLTSCSKPDVDVILISSTNIKASISEDEESVVHVAIQMFIKDYQAVFNAELETNSKDADILVGTINHASWAKNYVSKSDIEQLKAHEESFVLTVEGGKIVILGADKRGTAYGILELSRMIGVSPWEWWADSKPEQKNELLLSKDTKLFKHPSVARRGIFINDEDWGLMPWSGKTFEPSAIAGEIGPQTNAKIFELLLRLRANTYWPAMHKCSVAFFETPGNKEMADKYGIFVGTSHCEPMVRNTNAEWNREKRGRYNFLTNKEAIIGFWEERMKELAQSDNVYTLGLRGEHDGKMEGAETDKERMKIFADVIQEQRKLIAKYINPNIKKVSQVFIPYKEVLDAYKLGLEVPEDVTLMWCDDNIG